jgi:branched-subunit amino acid permease
MLSEEKEVFYSSGFLFVCLGLFWDAVNNNKILNMLGTGLQPDCFFLLFLSTLQNHSPKHGEAQTAHQFNRDTAAGLIL